VKINDPICKTCINHKKKVCAGECPPIRWINGKAARQEPLANDIISENYTSDQDYNQVLAERIEDHNEKINRIKDIPDKRKRAIAALISVNLTKTDIALFFHLSRMQITRLAK